MSAPKTRTDELLERWGSATARPVPAFDPYSRRIRRRLTAPALLLVTVGILILTFALGAILLTGGAAAPGPTPTTTPLSSSSPAIGDRRFEAPGFAFDPPSGWTDQTAAVSYPVMPEVRVVGYFIRGMTICPQGFGSQPPTPAGCEKDATRPGTATLAILEQTHQYPWLLATLGPKPIAGYPSVSRPDSWSIQSPDGGIYQLLLNSPKAEMAANAALVTKALDSLELTAWEQPAAVVNGLIHEDSGRGFTFDYPADWVRYYPDEPSMGASLLETLASAPLLPPCTNDPHSLPSGAPRVDFCGASTETPGFTQPPGTITIQFSIGSGPRLPDWSKANTTVGGQPALGPVDGSPQTAAGDKEGYSWEVRIRDQLYPQQPSEMIIYASLNGPGLPELRAAMNQLLNSMKVAAP